MVTRDTTAASSCGISSFGVGRLPPGRSILDFFGFGFGFGFGLALIFRTFGLASAVLAFFRAMATTPRS